MAGMAIMQRGALAVLLWAVPPGVFAAPDSGAYLAGRSGMRAADFASAAPYLVTAMQADPRNLILIESAIAALVGAGEVGAAAPLAAGLAGVDWRSQLGNMVRIATAAQADDWAGVIAELDAGRRVSPLSDALTRAWALVGTGDMAAALAAFDATIAAPGMRSFGLYHKALALALAGDFEGADAILSLPASEGLQRTRRAVLAHAQVLAALGRGEEAVAMLDSALAVTADPAIAALRDQIAGGAPAVWTLVDGPRAGLAEAYYSVAGAILDETDDASVLFHARIAQALDPRHVEATLLAAQMLDRLKQHDLAGAAYASVPAEDPAYPLAVIGRAEALRLSGDSEGAIAALTDMTAQWPDVAAGHSRLADFLRLTGRNAEAEAAYDRAIALTPAADRALWRLHYLRGIARFGQDDWPAAEADFIAALALSPDRPPVLNFYGYSLVERGERLEEALDMIRRAVAGDAENGAYVDSLGWALFRLGRHDEAVEHLERAASLEPGDAVINDHLGDAYWTVGRTREAAFQWHRALSFGPEAALADRIRRKLEVGLDAVLAEEGAASGG